MATAPQQNGSLHHSTVLSSFASLIPKQSKKTIQRLNVGADNQEKVQYAYSLGGIDFVYLLHAENGEWTFKRKHPLPYYRGNKAYYDFGLCGISNYYHPEIVNDKRMFTDWKWQVQQCYKLWKSGTTFYGAIHLKQSPKFKASISSQYIII